ncbi:MAG: hypothetical protein C0472_01015 [Erythrobacter sp.]|nr:hypothetical protein [Erythrobacter sp.]
MRKLPFPVEALLPQAGSLTFNTFGGSIEVPLQPFDLPEWPDVRTKVLIDCLPIVPAKAGALSGMTFEFGGVPSDQRPEGSVYIGYHHHPVDVMALRFGPAMGETVEVEFIAALMFDFEGLGAEEGGEYANAVWHAKASLRVVAPDTQH